MPYAAGLPHSSDPWYAPEGRRPSVTIITAVPGGVV
jgi:hypothetical protein